MEQSRIEAFTAEFEAHRPLLRTYLVRLTASAADTDDIVQDTWIKASGKLAEFRGDSSLKTWIFAIATNLARDLLRKQQRWPVNVTDLCKEAAMNHPTHFREAMAIAQESPYAAFEIKEHIAFCFLCIARSLPLEQHLCLLLKEIHEFTLAEIAEILDLSEALVKYHLRDARQSMIRVFEGRCSLINQEGACHQCSELNGIFNPQQQAQEALNRVKLVRESGRSDKEHLFSLRMEVLREIDPFRSGAHDLQLHHLEHNRRFMESFLKKNRQNPIPGEAPDV